MKSSDRQIAAARKIEPKDTMPAPPPSSSSSPDDTDKLEALDTIPTPPPESGTTDRVVIPPHRDVRIDDDRS